MDSATRTFVGQIREYLNDVEGRQHLPVSQETLDGLNGLLGDFEKADLSNDSTMSPGERQAADASQELLQDVRMNPEDSLTPGERAANQAAGAGAS